MSARRQMSIWRKVTKTWASTGRDSTRSRLPERTCAARSPIPGAKNGLDQPRERIEHAQEHHDLPEVPSAQRGRMSEKQGQREQRREQVETRARERRHEVRPVLQLFGGVQLPECADDFHPPAAP